MAIKWSLRKYIFFKITIKFDDDSDPFSTEVLILCIHLKEISMEYLKVNITMEELHSLLYETTYII